MDEELEIENPEDAGRGGDSVLAHLSLGEVVIPRQFMDDPETAEQIKAIFESFDTNIREFTVGDEANKINPETGYPEFGFFKSIKKLFKKIAPIASIALPFLFPGLGAGLGAALGLGGKAAGIVGSGLVGAGLGAASGGGLKGALLGGVTGGLSGGGLKAIGGALSGGGLGNAAGTTLAQASGIAGLQGPTQGSGLLGSLTKAGSIAGQGLGNISSIGGSSNLSSALGGLNSYNTQDDIEKKLLEAQGRAENAFSPYAQAGLGATNQLSDRLTQGFNPGDLTQDPGYQFRLQEGQKALNSSLAARGMGESGAALKAAQEYGQGLADQTYSDAYSRWLQQNQQLGGLSGQGQQAAGSLADVYGNQGNIQGAGALGKTSTVNKTLAELLTGQAQETDEYGNPLPRRSMYGFA